jgi:hypothetical protein
MVLCGDYNVVPTDFDIYNPRSWRKDALLQPQSRACWERLLAQGWTDAIRQLHPEEPIYTFWDYFRQHWQRNAGPAHRPPAPEPHAGAGPAGRRRGYLGAGRGKGERPRAGMDRTRSFEVRGAAAANPPPLGKFP